MGFQNNNSHNNNRPRVNSQNGNKYHGGNGNRHPNNNGNKVITHFAAAPYNFVSYDNQNLLGPSSDKELYSGTIECTLKALTPLLIAGATNDKDKDNENNGPKERDFFKLDNGKLVIPGSSLKGMIRTYVEALSRSAISIINDNKVFYRNVTERGDSDYKRLGNFPKQGEKILGGFIKQNGSKYKIYPADVHKVEDGERVNPQDRYKTGKFKGKENCYSFKRNSEEPLDVPAEVWKDFDTQRKDAKNKLWDREERNLRSENGGKIFYTVDPDDENKIIAIGSARYFRIGYKYKPKVLTLAEGCPARTYKNDFALHLFGCTNQNEAYKGKVSIEPAYFDKSTKKAEELTCILGTPHASDLAHYLCQPNINKPKKNNARDLANYNSRESALRGRKFYWHRDPEKNSDNKTINPKVFSLLKPIAKESETKFIVHLDKVNITELGAILKVLSNKSGHALKLGAGKAVGFGSVQISISKTNIIDISKKYKSLKSRLNSLQNLKDDQKESKEAEQNGLISQSIKAFEDYANIENGIPFNEQKYVKELETMTNFAKKPRNALTQNMKLRDGAPNFSDKVVLLDPIDVVKGNMKKNN